MTTRSLEAPVAKAPPGGSRRRLLAGLVAVVCGGAYGAGLARYLFESEPQRFSLLRTWPGVAILTVVCGAGVGVALLCDARGRTADQAGAVAFAPLALLLPLISVFSADVNLLRAQTLLAGGLGLWLALWFLAWRGSASMGRATSWAGAVSEWLPALALFALLLALYLRTLAPTVGEADTFEYQVAAARLGIAHGSGYPLFTLWGRLFAELPLGGTFAYRANLAGAVACCLAAVGVERVARRLGAKALPAVLAGLAYGVSPLLWERAADVTHHPLNAALLAACLYMCIELIDGAASRRWLYALAFVWGLSLTGHLTMLLLAPALALAVGWWLWAGYSTGLSAATPVRFSQHAARFTRYAARRLLPAGFFFLFGLSLILYIPIRWPAVNHGEWLSWNQFIYILKGGEAAVSFDPLLPFHDASHFAPWLQKITGEYSLAGFVLALAGLLALAVRYPRAASPRRRWAIALVAVLVFAGQAYFALAFVPSEPDWSNYFITVNVVTAVLMGLGLQGLLDIGAWVSQAAARPWLSNGLASVLLVGYSLIPLSSIWNTLPRVDRSQAWEPYRLGQYTLRQPLAAGAVILADPVHYAPLYYLQVVEKVRPDLDIAVLPDEQAYRSQLEESLAAGKAVYLGRYLSGLGSAYSLRSAGPLVEVSPLPFTAPVAMALPLSATLASGIRLLGYTAEALGTATSDAWPITLFWRTDLPADDNYLVSLRLVDGAGQVAWQSPERVPAGGLYPTNAWKPGETVSDFYLVPAASTLAPGDYLLQVGLFPAYRVADTSGWAPITALTVNRATPPPAPARLLRAQLGQNWLTGYDLPETVAPGATFMTTLYWLRDSNSDTVTAMGETRSLAAWPVGSVVPATYRVAAPAAGEQFTLWLPAPAAKGSAYCGWLMPAAGQCGLPPVRLVGEAVQAGAVNFDHQILLRQATLVTAAVKPGDFVDVRLEWQVLQSMTDDYTEFVHLVGPDGKLYGQVDSWPVNGTQRTSQWRPGQVINDAYHVQLSSDAPPGKYAVHVGFYLLATMERLPVLNVEDTPVDDHALISGLTVR